MRTRTSAGQVEMRREGGDLQAGVSALWVNGHGPEVTLEISSHRKGHWWDLREKELAGGGGRAWSLAGQEACMEATEGAMDTEKVEWLEDRGHEVRNS